MQTTRLPDGTYVTSPLILMGPHRMDAGAVSSCQHTEWVPIEGSRTLAPGAEALFLTQEQCRQCGAFRCHMTGDQEEMDAAHGYTGP